MGVSSLKDVKAAALKILGNKAKIPDPKGANLEKLKADFAKAEKEYHDAVDVLQKKILAMQNAASTTKNVYKQYQDLIATSDFGLDESDDDDKKKIKQAQDLIDGYLDDRMASQDRNIKNLDELDKHTMDIRKYKAPTS